MVFVLLLLLSTTLLVQSFNMSTIFVGKSEMPLTSAGGCGGSSVGDDYPISIDRVYFNGGIISLNGMSYNPELKYKIELLVKLIQRKGFMGATDRQKRSFTFGELRHQTEFNTSVLYASYEEVFRPNIVVLKLRKLFKKNSLLFCHKYFLPNSEEATEDVTTAPTSTPTL